MEALGTRWLDKPQLALVFNLSTESSPQPLHSASHSTPQELHFLREDTRKKNVVGRSNIPSLILTRKIPDGRFPFEARSDTISHYWTVPSAPLHRSRNQNPSFLRILPSPADLHKLSVSLSCNRTLQEPTTCKLTRSRHSSHHQKCLIIPQHPSRVSISSKSLSFDHKLQWKSCYTTSYH